MSSRFRGGLGGQWCSLNFRAPGQQRQGRFMSQKVAWFKSEHSRHLLTSSSLHLLTSSPLIVEVWRSGVKAQPNYSASRWPSSSLRASWLRLPLSPLPSCCSNWVSHSPSALHPPTPPLTLPRHLSLIIMMLTSFTSSIPSSSSLPPAPSSSSSKIFLFTYLFLHPQHLFHHPFFLLLITL